MGQLNLCVETIILQGDISDGFGKNAPIYHGGGGGRDGRGSLICEWKLYIL